MGTQFYGIGAAQNVDNAGEILFLDGLDNSRLVGVKDEHDNDDFFHTLGSVIKSRKIFSAETCEDEYQLRCWNYAQVPFLYCEGELADDTDHPNAKSAASVLKFSQRPDIPLDVGLSIDGAILERKDQAGTVTEDKTIGKNLTKTVGLAVAMTVKPCNPKCKMFLKNDLTKSVLDAPIPFIVLEAMSKEPAEKSFTESLGKSWELLCNLQRLKKSLDSYFTSFTGMKCKQCGTPVRFFKSADQIPNFCANCNSSFSLNELWGALNK